MFRKQVLEHDSQSAQTARILTGGCDLVLEARVKDVDELNTLFIKKVRMLLGVDKTHTMLVPTGSGRRFGRLWLLPCSSELCFSQQRHECVFFRFDVKVPSSEKFGEALAFLDRDEDDVVRESFAALELL